MCDTSSCKRTAPIPISLASMANLKDLLKSGANKIGVFSSMAFNILKACWHFSDQTNVDFLLKRFVKRLAIIKKFDKTFNNIKPHIRISSGVFYMMVQENQK